MNFIRATIFIFIVLCTIPTTGLSQDHPEPFSHPIKTGEIYSQVSHCPNCGMSINMWARTRHQFTIATTDYETCSIRCLADMVIKADTPPTKVKTATYFAPQNMGDATKGWYVIGSQAKGTMTRHSKIFFMTKDKAEKFIVRHGGTLATFDRALIKAQKELEPMRAKIQAQRLKKGKIANPSAKASCANCGMHPATYPKFRSQMNVKGVGILHFCSTRCLIKQKDSLAEKGSSIWVTVYPDGDIEFAKGLYYVVGSNLMGPMGPEALPFRKKEDAVAFSTQHGGEVKRFTELGPALVGTMNHHSKH